MSKPKNKKKLTNDYWKKRARQDKLKVIRTQEKGIDNLKRLLKTNLDDVEKKITAFYDKYADNYTDTLTYTQAVQYKMKLKQNAYKFKNDKILQKILREDAPKYKIERLRALQTDLQIQLAVATAGQQKGIYKTLEDVAKVSQASVKERFKDVSNVKFNTIADKKLQKIIGSDWSGKNWSDRLWKDREKVGMKVQELLETGLPQGRSLQDMARDLKDATQSSFNDAFRLIRTEAAHVDGQVKLEGYKQSAKDLGYTEYVYDAFLDDRTSKICQELNGQKFPIDEAEVGVNYPPMHPNCYDRLTQVMTNNGFKYFIDLQTNDKVLTLNPETLETEYQEPIAFYRYRYKGFMLLFEDDYINLKVTPEHNMLESGKLKKALLCEKIYQDTGKLEFINDFNKKYQFNGLIKRISYDDDVFCVEVEKYNTLLVKRKGKYAWCGNCRSTTHLYEGSIDEDIDFLL